jgi:hypothetical protein
MLMYVRRLILCVFLSKRLFLVLPTFPSPARPAQYARSDNPRNQTTIERLPRAGRPLLTRKSYAVEHGLARVAHRRYVLLGQCQIMTTTSSHGMVLQCYWPGATSQPCPWIIQPNGFLGCEEKDNRDVSIGRAEQGSAKKGT